MVQSTRQSGNVLFLILIAVALFGALGYAITQSTRSSSGGVDNEAQKLDFSTLLNYVVAIRTEAYRLKFETTEWPELGGVASDTNNCYAAPETCIFTNVPFYSSQDITDKLGIPIDMSLGGGGISGRSRIIDDVVYGFLVFRNVDQQTCEALNTSLEIAQVANMTTVDSDFSSLTAAELNIPVQCLETTSDGYHHILVQAYVTDTV